MNPSAGEITNMTVPWLLQDLRTGKKSGTLVFTREAEVKKVYLREGDILFASSNLKDDRLGEFLLRQGKIDKAQFDKSSETVVKTGKKLGAVLFEMGLLTSQDLVAQVKLQIKEIILRLFCWRNGSYQFDDGPLPLAEIIPLNMSTGDLIIEGVRSLDWQAVRKSLPPLKTIIRPSSNPSDLFQNAHLDHDQRTLLSLVDGGKNMEELCSLSRIGDFNALKAIYALLALRMTETGEIKSEEDMKFRHDAVQEAVGTEERDAARPEAAADVSVTKEMIQDAYASLERMNHYEVLGVGRAATPQEIKKAFLWHAKLYHPDRHFDPGMSDMKEKLDALFARIHDAYETLSSQTRRQAYNIDLASGGNAEKQARQQKPDNKNAALIQFKEGMKQYNIGNFWGADEAFQWALRLDPDEHEYVFHRGLSLSRMPRRGHEAEEYFLKALEMAPKQIEYYLELGNFYARSGVKEKALSVLQDALKLDANSEKIKTAIKKAGG